VRRVKKLSEATTKVSQGDFNEQISTRGHDELSKLTDNFNIMVRELKQNEYLSKEFAQNFSHELKTPISAIKGYAELISDGNLSKEEIENYSGIIVLEAIRLANLSKSMLQLSYLDSTTIVKREDTYNMAEQIREILQTLQPQWEAKNIALNLVLADGNIISNKELTYQIWMNLIDNAIKYTPVNGSVDILLEKREAAIHFEITNDGQGIAVPDQDKIFHLFFIGHPNLDNKSSGVGLALTKRMVEKMGGTISFNSVPNLKTTFMVDLR
jgi:signal transduction histidine kinase